MIEKLSCFLAVIAVVIILGTTVSVMSAAISYQTVVDEKTKTVEAVITDASRHGGNTSLIYTGKCFVPLRHREWYEITVSYDNEKYSVTSNDEDSYDEYKTKIGETVSAELVTKERKDGSVTTEITSITAKE